MKKVALTLALFFSFVLTANAQDDTNPFEAAAETCARTDDPEACLTTYGFRCHGSPARQTAVDAYRLSCNAPTGDGRNHHVQMLKHRGEWAIQYSRTSELASSHDDEPRTDPDAMLSAYVQEQMTNHNTQSSGTLLGSTGVIDFNTGVRREGGVLVLRGVCGSVIPPRYSPQQADRIHSQVRQECEARMLRSMQMLGPTPDNETYRVAAAHEIDWESSPVTVSADVDAIIVEGRYTFPSGHRPCLYVSDCCSTAGTMYLGNCREPTETELTAISACLEDKVRIRTPEFEACLREQDLRVGCELQPDGSKICY